MLQQGEQARVWGPMLYNCTLQKPREGERGKEGGCPRNYYYAGLGEALCLKGGNSGKFIDGKTSGWLGRVRRREKGDYRGARGYLTLTSKGVECSTNWMEGRGKGFR